MKNKKRRYLKNGDRVFTTGAFLIYDKGNNTFKVDEIIVDSIFFNGGLVECDLLRGDEPYVTQA